MLTPSTLSTRLQRTAAHHDVEMLYACESGSRAWGMASMDSDYDVRFIYRHPREWYLRLQPGNDQIGPIVEHDSQLDLVGWDVRKFLFHLAGSNPAVLEWLRSPEPYFREGSFREDCRELADQCFRPRRTIAHYLGIAHGARQAGEGEDGRWNVKQFCYWMRPILAAHFVATTGQRPPITITNLLKQVEDPTLVSLVERLVALKATVREDHRTSISPRLMSYFTQLRAKASASCNGLPDEVADHRRADALFRQTIGWE